MDILALSIDGLPALNVAALALCTLAVSFTVSAIGPTGGLQMAAVVATMPAPLVIPLHAWITGFSALFRAIGLRRFIDWRFFVRFAPASAVGAVLVARLLMGLDLTLIQAAVAIYILVSAVLSLTPHGALFSLAKRRPALFGLGTGALSMVIGASGPTLMTLMRGGYDDRRALSATFSACLTFQHLSKIVLFGLIGVSLLGYPVVLALTVAAAAIGSFAGRRLLLDLPERLFRILLAATLIVVSLSLLASLALK